MAKFWYALVNKNSNLTVKMAKSSVVFSKLLGQLEHFTDEDMALDNLVKKGVLTKTTDAEKKIMAKGQAKPAPKQIIQEKPIVKEEKPVTKPAPMPKAEPKKPEPKPEPQPEPKKPEPKKPEPKPEPDLI